MRIRAIATKGNFIKISLLALALTAFWASAAFAVEGSGDSPAAVVDEATVAEQPETDATVAETPAAEAGAEAEPAAADSGETDSGDEAVEPAGAPVDDPASEEPQDAVADGDSAVAAVSEEKCCSEEEVVQLLEDCEELEAILELICLKGDGNVFWESKADYEAGLLSMRYRLRNTSTDTSANNLRVVSATEVTNKGVKVDTELPLPLGSLQPGEWLYFLLKWQVPKGVSNFVTDISICGDCEEFCADCPPPCEGDECEPVCEGDECEPVCEGEGCNPPVDEEKDPPVEDPRSVAPLHASALPNTGFDMMLPLSLGLGLLMLGGLIPTVRAARQRKR